MNRKNVILITLIIVFSIGCKKQTKIFSEEDSVIELDASRQPDIKLGYQSLIGMNKKDGRFWDNVYPEVKGIPDSLFEVETYYFWLNNIQALYQAYKSGVVSKKDYMEYFNAWNEDTTNCTSDYVKTFVVIAAGNSKAGQRYYLFDSNNNFDLSDEPLYETSIVTKNMFINNNLDFQPHKVIYEKYKDGEIQKDSTWISFFESEDMMLIQFLEKASVKFQFDTLSYKIEMRPSISKRYRGGVDFNVSSAFNKRSKNYKEGEYLKLGQSYYQLTNSSDGLKIYLTKDENVLSKGSTQVGMPPIPFEAESLEGSKINFPSDYKGKYVLLDFWSITCGPCVHEIEEYYIDIYEKYGGDKFEILGVAADKPQNLESFINKNEIKWTIISDEEQWNIQKMYGILQYPTLFFINPEGEIIAKDSDLREGRFESILADNIQVEK